MTPPKNSPLPSVFMGNSFAGGFESGAQYVYAYGARKFPEDIEYVPASRLKALDHYLTAIIIRKNARIAELEGAAPVDVDSELRAYGIDTKADDLK